MRALTWVLFVLFLVVSLPACSSGPKKVKITGKVTYDGKAFQPADPKGGVNIVFMPVDDTKDKNTYPADFERETSTFKISGADGSLPVGKYKVTINQMSMNATPEMNAMNEKFGPGNTKIIRDIAETTTSIDIDLAKPEGK